MKSFFIRNQRAYLNDEFRKKLYFLIRYTEKNEWLRNIKDNSISYDAFTSMLTEVLTECNKIDRSNTFPNSSLPFKKMHESYRNQFKLLFGKMKGLSVLSTTHFNADRILKNCDTKEEHQSAIKDLTKLVELAYNKAYYDLKHEMYLRIILNSEIVYNGDLKYIKDEKVKKDFITRYKEYIVNYDVINMLTLMRELANYHKLNWIRELSSPIIDGDHFEFIGHSVKDTSKIKNNLNQYASCALFNNEHVYTLNHMFGYIMNPANIVIAAPYDLFSSQEIIDDFSIIFRSLTNYVSIKSVDEIRSCSEFAESFRRRETTDNEIVMRGFNPVGIFNFTFGIKGFDDALCNDFINANKDLKLYTFDILELAKGKEKDLVRERFLDLLFEDEYIIKKYIRVLGVEYFRDYFDALSNLKKQKEVTEEDARNVFRECLKNKDADADTEFLENCLAASKKKFIKK